MPTTTDYTSAGVHQLNHWLWSKLQGFQWNGTDLAFGEYGTTAPALVPIIPTQQQPEFTDIVGGAPFIVYNYIVNASPEWWQCRESNAYVIYDDNESRLRAIHNYMHDLLKRQDWTAKNINTYLGPASKYEFKTVSVSTARGPDKFTDEGGRQSAMITVSYMFTHDLDGIEGSGLRV